MSRKLWLLAGFSTLALVQPALAQQATADGASPPGGLEEIVVTAQKREQNVQIVPVSVSVLSAAAIERAGINDFTDIARVSPALTISSGPDGGTSSIYLRGVGTFSVSIGIEPSVSVVIDDVATVQQAQDFTDLSDIERIEVLRGPQGTLFGRNASAGVINIVTKAPSKEFTASAETSYTDDGQFRLSSSVSGPLSDKVGFRINSYYNNLDGYITNLNGGPKLNSSEGYGVRGKLAAQFTDDLDLTVIGNYDKLLSVGSVGTIEAAPASAKLLGAIPLFTVASPGITPGPGNFVTSLDAPIRDNTEDYSGQAKLSLQTDIGTVSSVSAYQHSSLYAASDVDGTAYNVDGAFTGGKINGSWNQSGPQSDHAFTEELKLVSPSSDTFEYLGGLFYNNSDSERAFQRAPISPALFDAATGSTTYAAYGQLSYHILPQTVINGALRYNDQDISVRFHNGLGTGAGCTDSSATTVSCSGASSQDAVTGKVSLQQFLDDGTMLFASYSTGYKGQGYDVSSGFTVNRINNPVQKETSKSYETGVKGKLFDNAVRYSLTGFWTDFAGYQAQTVAFIPLPAPGAFSAAVTNVGNVTTRGVEFEGSAKISDSFRVDLNSAYTDAYFSQFSNAPCYTNQTAAAGCVPTLFTLPGGGGTVIKSVQNLTGQRLSNAPEFKLYVNLAYEAPLGNTGYDGFANLAYQWQSLEHFDLFGDPLTTQNAYGTVNASIGAELADSDRIKITLFVNNLFDKHYAATNGNAAPLYGGAPVILQYFTRDAQRYFGFKVKTTF